jgi:hypothetical protein
MSNKINDYKKSTRIMSIIIRAAERCFPKTNIDQFEVSFSFDNFQLEFGGELFEGCYISASSSSEKVDNALTNFLHKIKSEIDEAIEEQEENEKEFCTELEAYGESYTESSAVNLTCLKMFQNIINSISLK